MRNPKEGNVEDSVHAVNPGSASLREGVGVDLTGLGVCSKVSVARSVLDTDKDEEKENGETHAGGGEHGHEGDVLEGSRNGHNNAHDRNDDAEDDGTHAVIGEGIDDLGAGKDVETDQQDVVGKEHESGEVVCNHGFAKDFVAEVADVFDVRVLHDITMHRDTCRPEDGATDQHRQDTRDPSQNREGPRLGHDGKTDLVTAEQPSSLLPGHGSELDFMAVILDDQRSEAIDAAVGILDIAVDLMSRNNAVSLLVGDLVGLIVNVLECRHCEGRR